MRPRATQRRAVAALTSFATLYLGLSGAAQAVPAVPSGFSDQAVVSNVAYGTTVA